MQAMQDQLQDVQNRLRQQRLDVDRPRPPAPRPPWRHLPRHGPVLGGSARSREGAGGTWGAGRGRFFGDFGSGVAVVSGFWCLCGAGTARGPQCAASLSRFHRVRTAVRARSWIPDKAQFRWGAPLAGDTEGSSARTPASKCIMVRTDLPVPPGALASTANAAGGGAFYELLSNACSLPPVRSQRAVSPH